MRPLSPSDCYCFSAAWRFFITMPKSAKGFDPNRGTQSQPPNQRDRLRQTLLAAVETQIQTNTPPETRQALKRLLAEGHLEEEARRLIASVLIAEMNTVLQQDQPYSEERYTAALQRLSQLPPSNE